MGTEKSDSPSQSSPAGSRVFRFDPRSISFRFVVVGAVIVASMIPLQLVSCTVDDREWYRNKAVRDVAAAWGGQQRIAGPIMVIPIDNSESEDGGEHYVAVMPERFDISVDTHHEVRHRGIFETLILSADINAEGAFTPLDAEALRARFGALRLDLTSLAIGISDPRGIREATLVWREGEVPLSATSGHGSGPIQGGLESELGDAAARGGAFSLKISLRGMERFSVVPVGDISMVAMQSTWPHPSFDGGLLPDTRDVTPDGFTASWTARDLARGFPSVMRFSSTEDDDYFEGKDDYFEGKDLGFTVFEPVDLYSSVERSIKYGVLFVVLTLVSVLCLELSTGIRFHFVQYCVTSVALVLFFLTLLALAEHVGFTLGYVAAAVVLTGMIGWYVHGSTGNHRLAAASFGSLAVLYAGLYTLLRLEDFALLVGTVVLLAALGMLMRVTRGLTPGLGEGA